MTDNLKFEDANSLLEYMKTHKGLEFSAPIDVNKIIKELGISVEYDSSIAGQVGGIKLIDTNKAVITLNPFENEYKPRERFTLAHEVAHFCLHLSEDKKTFLDTRKTMSRSGSYWDKYETEANTFAAELLMPKQLILNAVRQLLDRAPEERPETIEDLIDFLSRNFNVSYQAMDYRFKRLGLV